MNKSCIPTSDDLGVVKPVYRPSNYRLCLKLAEKHRFSTGLSNSPGIRTGGFDVILCNPPWEILELHETEFFFTKDENIAFADKKETREKLIKNLPKIILLE